MGLRPDAEMEEEEKEEVCAKEVEESKVGVEVEEGIGSCHIGNVIYVPNTP